MNTVREFSPVVFAFFIGIFLGRNAKLPTNQISKFLIFIMAPLVVFWNVIHKQLAPSDLLLPVVFFCVCSLVSLISLRVLSLWNRGPRQHADSEVSQAGTKNSTNAKSGASPKNGLLAYAFGSGNSGYFGFPLTVSMLGVASLPTAVLCSFGFIVFEFTLGYYLLARDRWNPRESLQKLIKFPSLYALALALVVNGLNGPVQWDHWVFSVGARLFYSFLGMFIVGLALSKSKELIPSVSDLKHLFLFKNLLWPAVVAIIILTDQYFLKLFSVETHRVMWVMSLVPLPANSVAFAALFNGVESEMAVLVVWSTLSSLLFVALYWFLGHSLLLGY